MGRYNSRLDVGGEGEQTGQKKEWTCNKCSEIFYEQKLYIEHVKERNLKRKCPGAGRGELLVLDDSPPGAVMKTERTRPAQKRSGSPTEVFLDDFPSCITLDLSDESQNLPPSTVDTELPIVAPPGQSSLSLEPISDQSLPTSPVNTSAPSSLPEVPNTEFPPVAEGSSPPRLPQEIMQSRVMYLKTDFFLAG